MIQLLTNQEIRNIFRIRSLVLCLVSGLVFAFVVPFAQAQVSAPLPNRLLEIMPGVSFADLTGDGKPEIILKAWRDNGNAHNAHIISFIEHESDAASKLSEKLPGLYFELRLLKEQTWNELQGGLGKEAVMPGAFSLIGIEEDPNQPASNSVWTSGAADCMITDYRLFFKGESVFMIKGFKDSTESFCDKNYVAFTILWLVHNTEPLFGYQEYYFKEIHKGFSKNKYDDVEEAFFKEADSIIDLIP